ncbi:DKNYY domain-containing protein [Arenibacter echinorum]|uniref:DKNYY family protein n=1 Tax=Arenibacter echinorum TaxID=440515 RepID=A0A327QUQ7_9FLAO|nr:DKNYY domain-containing protein [Arenibacter echinorum]RAJ08011.1 DKNYY family protein [Arenibacter echinorum]
MENKAKIITLLSLIILAINLTCNNRTQRNNLLCSRGENGKWSIILEEDVLIDMVYVDNKAIAIDKTIDCKTFNYLFKFSEDSLKLNNTYYTHNPPKNYFKDKNFIYFLMCATPENCQLVKKCSVNEYELMGGEYIKIYRNVYWQGHKIHNADANTFNTMNVIQDKSEWELTVGFDKNFIYNQASVMSKKRFESLYWINKDSLRLYYHY